MIFYFRAGDIFFLSYPIVYVQNYMTKAHDQYITQLSYNFQLLTNCGLVMPGDTDVGQNWLR